MFYFDSFSSVTTLRKEVGLCRWGHQEDRTCTREECFHGVFNFVFRYREWVIIHKDSSIEKPEWHPQHQIPIETNRVVLVLQVMWVTVKTLMPTSVKEWVTLYWERSENKNYHVQGRSSWKKIETWGLA